MRSLGLVFFFFDSEKSFVSGGRSESVKGFHELGGGCASEFPGARLSGRAAGSSGSQTPLWTPSPGAQCVSRPAEPPARKSSPRGFQLGHYFTDYLMGSECTAGLMYPQFSNSRLRLVSWSRFSCHDEVYNFRLRLLS